VRDFCEGKPQKVRSLNTAVARNKATNFEQAEPAEELRKLVSGSGSGLRTVRSRG